MPPIPKHIVYLVKPNTLLILHIHCKNQSETSISFHCILPKVRPRPQAASSLAGMRLVFLGKKSQLEIER